jgi:glycerol uptake facilitator-like aquaporin
MAKSKAKHAKNRAAKHNSVETEKAKAIKKGEEEIIEDEELEEVEDTEEVEDEDVEEVEDEDDEDDEESEEESEDDEESEEDDDDEEDEDSEEEDDSEDEDEDEDDEESEDESEDEDEDDEEDDSEDDDDDEEEDEDEDDDEEEDEESSDKKEASVRTKTTKVTTKVIASSKKDSKLKTFFARKGDENENILTIFKNTRIIGAIIGEILGTAVITMIVLTLGLFNPLYMILGYVGITLAVVKLSGAHLNPIVTAGMMASRRVSAIRGVIYLISQILGAWFGYWIINKFYQAGINSGNIDAASTVLPSLSAITDLKGANEDYSLFWATTMIEFVGAIIIAFFFARAVRVKKQSETAFAITAATGMFIAMLLAVVINSNFFMQQENTFVLNPAIGMIYGIFPTSAEGFDALMDALLPMLVAYVLFPVLGGIIGFFVSDFATLSQGEDLKDNA